MITVERIGRQSDAILRNLYEHYVHDMSEWLALDTRPDGTFGHDTSPLWDGDFVVYLAKVDDQLAGFAVVAKVESWVPDRVARDVKDFFVLRRYRHRAVGDALADHMWNESPGLWQVRVLVANRPGAAFWQRRVRGRCGERYEARRVRDRGKDWFHLRWDSLPAEG